MADRKQLELARALLAGRVDRRDFLKQASALGISAAAANLFLRAEPLHPGAQPTLLDADGHRITAFLTNSPRWHGPFLDARHRARGRCENRIKTLKNTGLGKLPFFDFAANQAWANIAALALNLVSWLQLAALPDGHHAKAWDIKRWRTWWQENRLR